MTRRGLVACRVFVPIVVSKPTESLRKFSQIENVSRHLLRVSIQRRNTPARLDKTSQEEVERIRREHLAKVKKNLFANKPGPPAMSCDK